MTSETGDGSDGADTEQTKSADGSMPPTKGGKPSRKVSKTIMEGATPQVPDEAAGRKLAKTLVELSRPALTEVAAASIAEHQEQPSDAPKPATRKVPKTMLELSLPADFLTSNQGRKVSKTLLDTVKVSAPEPRSERYVAKTMLDHKVLYSALEKSAEKKKVRAAEVALERANEPVKEFHQVESKKMATPCSFTWPESSGERVRACSQCHTPVYDFKGMELAEAEALIFKQESVKKATLFKRADGKFMTKDCPLQARRKRKLLLLCVVGALVLLSALAVLTMMPPQPTPTSTIVVKSKHLTNSESKVTTPLQGDGTFHYRAGEPEDVQPNSNSPTVNGTSAPTPSSTTTTTTTTTTSDTEMEWDTSGAN